MVNRIVAKDLTTVWWNGCTIVAFGIVFTQSPRRNRCPMTCTGNHWRWINHGKPHATQTCQGDYWSKRNMNIQHKAETKHHNNKNHPMRSKPSTAETATVEDFCSSGHHLPCFGTATSVESGVKSDEIGSSGGDFYSFLVGGKRGSNKFIKTIGGIHGGIAWYRYIYTSWIEMYISIKN